MKWHRVERSRSVKTAFLTFALAFIFAFASQPAAAKSINFSKTLFGIELSALGMKSPKISFLPDSGSFESEYAYEYRTALFLDMSSVILLRPGFSILSISDARAKGTDSADSRNFTQSIEASGTLLAGKISLVPLLSADNKRRIYFGGEIGIANVSIKRKRTYASGAEETNSQEASGSELYYGGHIGFEMFFIQNYSLQLEVGYRRIELNSFEHNSGTSMKGAAIDEGTELLDEEGRNENFSLNGLSTSVSFNLHF